jgi:hypothetical protein
MPGGWCFAKAAAVSKVFLDSVDPLLRVAVASYSILILSGGRWYDLFRHERLPHMHIEMWWISAGKRVNQKKTRSSGCCQTLKP